MIVTCPDCSAQYLLPDESIGARRRVKCTTCAFVWTVTPPEPQAGDIFVSAFDPDQDEALFRKPARPDPALLADIREAAHPLTVRGNVGEFLRKIGMVTLSLLATTAIFAVLFRQILADSWPPVSLLYEKLHIPVQGLGQGFEISEVVFADQADGAEDPTLSVTGKVSNLTDEALSLPDLLVSQKNHAGQEKSWPLLLHGRRIKPKQAVSFHYELKHAFPRSQSAAVTFTR